ncbi:hypothetical protein B0H10DRAFT_607812 [Mycena sp. CBHHK59/15]|nr:hypothetical protein B0H10DRAFT_607812 [Mycena sp. CBHHK59/15]
MDSESAKSDIEHRSVLRDARARIAELDYQISALESEIRGMRSEQKKLHKTLDGYIYPVVTLPNEVTSEIFVHFPPVFPKRPPPTGLFSPTLLGQICRKWREIAFSTPSIWRAVALDLRHPKFLDQKLHLLQLWLDRARNCSLSISLYSSETTALSLSEFVEAVLPHCTRWEDMEFVLSDADLRRIQGKMPLLQHLKVGPESRLQTLYRTFLRSSFSTKHLD